MKNIPRVALFADSFHEVNGVANTCRYLHEYAKRQGFPFLSIHAGGRNVQFREGAVTTLELKRSPLSFWLDQDLKFDLSLWRHAAKAIRVVKDFSPDLVHITGPSDVGQLGAWVACKLGLPIVASWHTNLHDFAARRLERSLSFLPASSKSRSSALASRQVLKATLKFYRLARVVMAPNEELVDRIKAETGRPVYLMQRGVDTELFSPSRRILNDSVFRLGYVGRLTPEKNVRFLVEIEEALMAAGKSKFEFLIVGDGSERQWLERRMKCANFTGVLKGQALARTYASMDAFIFPSKTDAFGNVVLEALASGVPAIVFSEGGPRFLVENGVCGYAVSDDAAFFKSTIRLMSDALLRSFMRENARKRACAFSWDSVFEKVYHVYSASLESGSCEIGSVDADAADKASLPVATV